jgi:hypothetical protein
MASKGRKSAVRKLPVATAIILLASAGAYASDVTFTTTSGSSVIVIDFGNVETGTSVAEDVVITNTSGEDIQNFTVLVTGPITRGSAPHAEMTGCEMQDSLKMESCVATIVFTPMRNGKFKGKLEVEGTVTDANGQRDVSESRDIIGENMPNQ